MAGKEKMKMSLLELGMKYRKSKCWLLRFAANLCIAWEKKWTEREEEKLKRQGVKNIDAQAAEEVYKKIQKKEL